MVSAEAYTIDEFVLYMVIMYIFILVNLAVAYITNKIQDSENNKKMYLTGSIAVMFGIIPFLNFRIGAIFYGIGCMCMMVMYNVWDSYDAYKITQEEEYNEWDEVYRG